MKLRIYSKTTITESFGGLTLRFPDIRDQLQYFDEDLQEWREVPKVHETVYHKWQEEAESE